MCVLRDGRAAYSAVDPPRDGAVGDQREVVPRVFQVRLRARARAEDY